MYIYVYIYIYGPVAPPVASASATHPLSQPHTPTSRALTCYKHGHVQTHTIL